MSADQQDRELAELVAPRGERLRRGVEQAAGLGLAPLAVREDAAKDLDGILVRGAAQRAEPCRDALHLSRPEVEPGEPQARPRGQVRQVGGSGGSLDVGQRRPRVDGAARELVRDRAVERA